MTTNIDTVQTFKIVIIGDAGVGKSSLMNRCVHNVFHTHYTATIGVDFKVATINIGEYKCRLQLWDTAGQERFHSMTSSYYRGADGIIIVYDVTNKQSFNHIIAQLPEIGHYCDVNVPKVLLGNKNDVINQRNKIILTPDARKYAEQNHLLFFETSVKDNKNITEIFDQLAKLVLQRRLHQSRRIKHSMSIEENQPINNATKTKCCIL